MFSSFMHLFKGMYKQKKKDIIRDAFSVVAVLIGFFWHEL